MLLKQPSYWIWGRYLEVVEGVDEGDEAPGLVFELQG